MGLAIVWVYLFHSTAQFPDTLMFRPIRVFVSLGYGGVDLFLFLSGYGLMYGMVKSNYSILEFYKKRILRILPAYVISVVLIFLLRYLLGNSVEPFEIAAKLSTIWFWIGMGEQHLWYIPAILALYLIFPFYYKLFTESKNKQRFTLMALLAGYGLTGVAFLMGLSHLQIFLTRIPVFFVGIYTFHIRHNLREDNRAIIKHAVISSIALLALIATKFLSFQIKQATVIRFLPFILFSYSSLFISSKILSYLDSKEIKLLTGFISFFRFLGTYSLEIYLLHECLVFPAGEAIIQTYLSTFSLFETLNMGRHLEFSVYFLVTVFLAVLLHISSVYLLGFGRYFVKAAANKPL